MWELVKNWGLLAVSILSALDALRIRFFPTVVPIPSPTPAPIPVPPPIFVPTPLPPPPPPKPIPKPEPIIVPTPEPQDERIEAFEALLTLKEKAKELIADETQRTAALAGLTAYVSGMFTDKK